MPQQGDSFKKVQAGWPLSIPAETYNAFIDAAQFVKDRRQNLATPASDIWRDASIVRVKNNTGGALKQFAVLGISGPAITPESSLSGFSQWPVLAGATPSFANHRGKFAVAIEPCPAGGMARCVLSGCVIVQLNVRSSLHVRADVDDGQTGDLASSHSGAAQILWVDSSSGSGLGSDSSGTLGGMSSGSLSGASSGLAWAIVRLGPFGPCFFHGKASANIAQGASGSVEVYVGPPGSETDSGVSETVQSPYGAVTGGDFCGCAWNGFGFYVIAEDCAGG